MKKKNTSDNINCKRVNGILIPRLHGGRLTIRFKSPKDYNRKSAKEAINEEN